jgi:hypothetical protein
VEQFIEALADIVAQVPPGKFVLLAGDLNCRIDAPAPPPRTICFLNYLNEVGLWLCSTPLPWTFDSLQGSSTIDLFATSLPVESIRYLGLIEGRSIHLFRNHVPVALALNVPREPEEVLSPPKISRFVRPDLLRAALADVQRSAEWTTGDVEVAVKLLGEAVAGAVPLLPPKNRRAQPWFNAQCFEARSRLLQARILFRTHTYMRPLFVKLRRAYKACLRAHRTQWQTLYEQRLLAAAEAEPYKFGRRQGTRAACPIPAHTMMAHFRDIAGGVSTVPPPTAPTLELPPSEEQADWGERLNDRFTSQEVQHVIDGLPSGKAGGPDQLVYEHLKNAPELTQALTHIYNRCLTESRFPADWTTCLMVLIPKGKGSLSAPESWRGISKKSVLGKLFASLLARRLMRFLYNCDMIPPEQHGFLPGRSTSTAVAALSKYLDATLRADGTPVYAAFIDFRAAFNTASRKAIIDTLAECGVSGPFLKLLNAMLAPNLIRLFDGIRVLPEFTQDTGLPQGDTIASLLFVVLLIHLPAYIKQQVPRAVPDLYADDLLILALLLGDLRAAILAAKFHAAQRGLEINWEKTKIMKFRRGGRFALTDVCSIDGFSIPFVSDFVYLGVTFTVTASTFTKHVQDRRAKAITAICQLPSPRSLSLAAAVNYFRMKIAPMVTYGMPECWTWLKVSDFVAIDGVLMCFLRRALGVSKFARSRLILLLTGVKLTTEELVRSYGLPLTPRYQEYLLEVEEKLAMVDEDFLASSAMLDMGWAASLSTVRSPLCRYAIHGFHHIFCGRAAFHEPQLSCRCRYCGSPCQRYHLPHCNQPPVTSVIQLALIPIHLDDDQSPR